MAAESSAPEGPLPQDHPPDAPVPSSSDDAGAEEGDKRHPIRRFIELLGPGLITGASDDDPSGIGTYTTAGASFGYATLWTALITFPLMTAVQFVCAKIGMVTGRGLAGVICRHSPRAVVYPVVWGLVIANTINAGADLEAVAAGINLLAPIPTGYLVLPIALAILAVQVWGSYRTIARIFKWLTLSLFAYIGAAILAKPDPGAVLRGTFLPVVRLDGQFLATMVALLGTTISPYLFFWQANQEVEEEIAKGRKRVRDRRGATDAELRHASWDIAAGMLLSNVVMYFIILGTAATLHQSGKTDVNSAADAAVALRPLAGDAAEVLMALGLIGSGILAIPILTASGAYAVSEALGWKCGLDRKPGQAKGFYGIIAASTLAGLIIDWMGINPIDALFWTAVINGLLAPPLLVIIMRIANNREIMGDRVNGPLVNALGWATTAAMFAAAIGLALTWGRS